MTNSISQQNYFSNLQTGQVLEIMKSLRKERGFSQTEIAIKMWHISKDSEALKSSAKVKYSKIERGVTELSMQDVFSFCEAVEINPLFFFSGPKSLDELIQLLNHWKSKKQTKQTHK